MDSLDHAVDSLQFKSAKLVTLSSVIEKMRLMIVENVEKAASLVAKYVVKRINDYRPTADRCFVMGLPTGNSSAEFYLKLLELYRNGEVSFRNVITFNMAEYVGLTKDHQQSYHHYMYEHFFKHVDMDPKNVYMLDGNASDLKLECENYERKIEEVGGIHLFIGGIEIDGNVAFNEPGSSLKSRTRLTTLTKEIRVEQSKYFGGDYRQVPKEILTIGVGTIMDVHQVVLLITGSRRALALHRAIEQGPNHMCTMSTFQMHPNTLVVCDEDASAELSTRTVRYSKALDRTIGSTIDESYSLDSITS